MPIDNQSGQGTQKGQPKPEENEFNKQPGQQRDPSKQGQQHDPNKQQGGKQHEETDERNRSADRRDR